MLIGTVLITLSGCASLSSQAEQSRLGTVRGRMIFMGGPAPGAWPVSPGVVVLRGATAKRVAVDPRGHFQVSVDPGTYQVTGMSPKFGNGTYVCRTTHAVVVAPATTSYVVVGCLVR